VVALLPIWRPVDPRSGVPLAVLTDAPPGITAAVRDNVRPGDRILNPQRWGSWLEFAVPSALVAVDSRIEFIPASVWTDYEGAFAGVDGWKERLAGWGVTLAITEPTDASLERRLRDLGWQVLHQDSDGIVWVAGAP
jgi:hypothetical protein